MTQKGTFLRCFRIFQMSGLADRVFLSQNLFYNYRFIC
jgi:hypothetical protein